MTVTTMRSVTMASASVFLDSSKMRAVTALVSPNFRTFLSFCFYIGCPSSIKLISVTMDSTGGPSDYYMKEKEKKKENLV